MKLHDWVGVLAISTKYCIQAGLEQAIDALKNPTGPTRFEPCFKLRLAWEYSVESWYEECILDILALPPMEIRKEDVDDLESAISAAIITVRARIARHRLELIPFIPDVIHDADCSDRGRCSKDWTSCYSFAMLYFAHTRRFYTGREVYQKLKKIEPPSLYEGCRRLTIEDIENRGVLWKEETFIRAGVEAIKQILGSTRPRTLRPNPRFTSTNDARNREGFYVM